MFHWANPKRKQNAALFRMAREERLQAFQNGSQIEECCAQRKGAQIEDAALKERRANRDRELFRMARE